AWMQFWQVTVLIAAVGLLTRLVLRRRPHLSYVLWMLVLVKCVTPPLIPSRFGLFTHLKTAPSAVAQASEMRHATKAAPSAHPANRSLREEDAAAGGADIEISRMKARITASTGIRLSGHGGILIWLSGSFVALIGMTLALRRFTARVRQSWSLPD